MTVPGTRDIYIRCKWVPLAEVYCSVSENFPLVWTNENRELNVEVIPACGAAEAGEFSLESQPAPKTTEGGKGGKG